MKYVIPSLATISGISWDTDLIIPTGKQINSVDTSGTLGANFKGQTGGVIGGVL